jgi:diguanylate cyclase (GGDEF)-like protein
VSRPFSALLAGSVLGYAWLRRGALIRDLRTAARTDGKTGLLNAGAWDELARRELARAGREGGAVAILIIDVDRFKLINDRFGHLAGDVVLRDIGRQLTAGVREYDVVGRFGGEEFVVALPGVAQQQALRIAERLRARINQLDVSALVARRGGPGTAELSVSIGIACFPADGADVAGLVEAADAAMYRAKTQGRNRVVLAR